MKKIYFLFFFILFKITTAQAQSIVNAYVKISNIQAINIPETTVGQNHLELRFNFFQNQVLGTHLNPDGSCLQIDNVDEDGTRDLGLSNYILKPVQVNLSNPVFTVAFEAWDEDGSNSDCSYNGPDDEYATAIQSFNISNFSPGVFSSTLYIYAYIPNSGRYRFDVQIKYDLPAPSKPISPSLTEYGKNCGAEELQTISTSTDLPNKTGLTYNWEYFTEGDSTQVQNPAWCYWDWNDPNPGPYPEPVEAFKIIDGPVDPPPCAYEPPYISIPRWKSLGQTASPSVQFIPNQLLSSGITQDTTIHFRAKLGSTLSSDQSAVSGEVIYQFSPPAPKIKPEDITTVPSCPGIGSGQINIAAIQGVVKNYTYILKRGFNKIYTCDPEGQTQGSACLTDVEKWGKINTSSSPDASISDIKAGQYTLMILNAGINKGVCFNTYNVEVTEYPPLQITASKIEKQISCADASDGEISLETSGGSVNPLIFSISPVLGNLTVNGRNALYTGLPAGTYTVTVKDECGQEQSQLHTIAAVTRVSGSISSIDPVCNSPSNGQISVTADHGSGNYDYFLIKGTDILDTKKGSAEKTWIINDLPAGDYTIEIKDASRPSCDGFTQQLTLSALPPLSLSISQQSPASCFNSADGSVDLTAGGGTGTYIYKLTEAATANVLSNTTGKFTNLAKGNYTAEVFNDLANCNDSGTLTGPLTITAPEPLAILITKEDVTCAGNSDGKLFAAVSGGNGNYMYKWERLFGTSWSSLSATAAALTNMQPGTYKLTITDAKACSIESAEITVNEPLPLMITNVLSTDIICLNDKGKITVDATGGNGNYIYQFSSDNKQTYTVFNNGDAFTAGTYWLKVTDSKGCTAEYPQSISITNPPALVDFSTTLSVYNNYNISCKGSSTGQISITPAGGNGQGYSAYTYALNNGNFHSGPVFNDLTAGTYMVQVKDQRGCIVTKPVTLTEPASDLDIVLKSKTDIHCAGENDGSFEVEATGGAGPYLYSLNNGINTTSPVFTNLAKGSYQVKVTDRSGCVDVLDVTLNELFLPLVLNQQITDVSCYAGNNGAIQLNPAGGTPPFTIQWKDYPGQVSTLSQLHAGTYTVTVTDANGCHKTQVLEVKQPVALTAKVTSKPVCFGSVSGMITVAAAGGTAPYSYSINGGSTYQNEAEFNSVLPGSYNLIVKDANGCLLPVNTTLSVKNTKPDLNFLVSTQQNALDTLVIKEISVPKPDQVIWEFDPQVTVIDAGPVSPKIKFSIPGNYWVRMTGFFGGCDYTLEKFIEIKPYDPNAVKQLVNNNVIEEVVVYPNPNNGQFSYTIKLNKPQRALVYIVDLIGKEYYRKKFESTSDITEQVQLDKFASGVLVMKIITDSETRDIKIVAN
jgi:SprB repeat